MAVIRCPNCGKPNPDFLEVCQYCDAQLHPAGAAPAAPPAAPAGASGPADETLIRKPPAVPAASAPPTPPAEDTTPASEPQDWMSRLRGLRSAEAAPQAADEPDWMWTGQAADASIGPPPDTEHGEAQAPTHDSASGELPEWLRDLDQPIDLAPKAAASGPTAQPPAEVPAQPPAAPAP